MDQENNSVTLTRQQLYEKVWSTSVRALAKHYSVRDQDISKLCEKYSIPRPPAGYWQKIQHGYKIPQPPLPASESNALQEITIYKLGENIGFLELKPKKVEVNDEIIKVNP